MPPTRYNPRHGAKAAPIQGTFLWGGEKVRGSYAFDAIETPDPEDA